MLSFININKYCITVIKWCFGFRTSMNENIETLIGTGTDISHEQVELRVSRITGV